MSEHFIIRFFKEEEWQSVNYTIRWNGKRRCKDETLKDHLFLCGVFSTILIEDILPDEIALHLEVTRAALFHDFVDEALTGDLSHDLKYNEVNGAELRCLLFDFVLKKTSEKLDSEVASEKILIKSIQYDKSSVVYRVIKFIDWLACYYYVCQEIEMGNKSFLKYLQKIEDKIIQVSEDLVEDFSFYYPTKFNKKPIFDIINFVRQNNKEYVNTRTI